MKEETPLHLFDREINMLYEFKEMIAKGYKPRLIKLRRGSRIGWYKEKE